MPRPVKPRTVGEYIEVGTRLFRQIDVDTKISPKVRARIKQALAEALKELNAVLAKL